VDNRNAPAFFL